MINERGEPVADPKHPHLYSLTYLGFQLNAYLEDGNDGLTFDEVYDGLDKGTLWGVINAKHPTMDLSLLTKSDPAEGARLIQALLDASEGMRERERRKYGVNGSGLALLLAYTLEAIQQEYWVPASDSKYRPK